MFNSKELEEVPIKMGIGLLGDTIRIDDGIVTIKEEFIEEKYAENNKFDYTGEFIVPNGEYLLLCYDIKNTMIQCLGLINI